MAKCLGLAIQAPGHGPCVAQLCGFGLPRTCASSGAICVLPGLAAELRLLAERLRPSEARLIQRQNALRRVEQTAKAVVDGCTAVPFGSAASGLWTEHSDLDICLMVPGCDQRGAQVGVLKKVARELRRLGASHHVEPRFGAQMPLLRWAPRREGQLACDITVNNSLAVMNSRLIGQYALADARMPQLAAAIKFWAARRRINDRHRGTLSSFSLTLMLVHFLQRRMSPVLPSLQDIAVRKKRTPVFIQGLDCRFSTDTAEARMELERLRGADGSPDGDADDGSLLNEFFHHFGHEYQGGCIAIRDRSMFVATEAEQQSYMFVDNPFQPGKDVANVEPQEYTRLREEFRRAHSMLDAGAKFNDVCSDAREAWQAPLDGPFLPGVNAFIGSPAQR